MRLSSLLQLAAVFLLAGCAFAQTATTTLRGIVTDPQKAVISGAQVTLLNPSTGFTRSTTTSAEGEYQFVQIPPGNYTLTVTSTGFGTYKQENLQLLVATPATVNLTMRVAAEATQVEVTSEAPLVNTQDASIGNAFDSKQIQTLPFEGRDPVGILSLQPGAVYIGQQSNHVQDADSRGGAVNGARSDQTNVVLDGVDNNDQTRGYAFQGALRSTLDSVQEFRVTTTNANADTGRSEGAQVNLVTKSGTNNFHGSIYEYHRNTATSANDWFNKAAQIEQGQPNTPPKLIRNTFGGSIGGPLKKDRIFFFAAYEGQRTQENQQVTRTVPSDTLRQGIIRYPCDKTDPNCTTANPLVSMVNVGGSVVPVATLGPAQILSMDPVVAQGVNPAMLPILQSYPSPNIDNAINDDFLNLRGFTFAAPNPAKQDTYIVRLDFRLTQSGNHNLFVRGNLMNDHHSLAPQFPGQDPSVIQTNNSKGIAIGYMANLGNNKVNMFRYGFVRQGIGNSGSQLPHHILLRFFDNPLSFDRSLLFNVPVHSFSDDFTLVRGKHTFQVGGNWRIITNNRLSSLASFSTASTNQFWLDNGGIAGTGSSLDPGAFGLPAVDPNAGFGYDAAMMALTGIVSEVDTQFNTDKSGAVLPEGQPIPRHFRSNEMEFYGQDTWRLTQNLTVTLGARWTLLQPPYEMNGNQVTPTPGTHDFFEQRFQHMLLGEPFTPQFTFQLSGQANGKQPYWPWNYHDIAPRIALAYSPSADSGWMHKIFGGPGKSSIRFGYGMYYDHFGMGIVDSFDNNGSFGLNSTLTNPAGIQDVDCAPRATGLFTFPTGTFCGQNMSPPLPANPFAPPADLFAIAWGIDDKIKTPYAHVFDLSVTRELPKGFVFEAAYVGRLGRHLLQQLDLAQPLDLRDPVSGMDYYTAMAELANFANQGASSVPPIPFFENMFGPGATAAIYPVEQSFVGNETTTLAIIDTPGCAPCSKFGPFAFFHNQYASLYAWSSIGTSNYHAGQFILRRRSGPLQFDFNYTLSKALDIGSDTERNGFFDVPVGAGLSFFPDQIVNAWSPRQLYGRSTFDTRHNINTNWYYEFPFGTGRKFTSGSRIVNGIFGNWSWTGLARWTSGLPFSVGTCAGCFPTDWELGGNAFNIAPLRTGQFELSGGPNLFADPTNAPSGFRSALPGESGQRNNLTGPGFFGIDMALEKVFKVTEGSNLKFRWEVFNVTNSVRFDVGTANLTFDAPQFGGFTTTLTQPRKMEFAVRYEF